MNFNRFSKKLTGFVWLTIFIVLMSFAGGTYAQSGTSSIRGSVTDEQGRIIAGATVTLRSEGKNFTRSQTTNSDGQYVFSAIPPDKYSIEIEATGFKKSVIPNVEALIETPKDINVSLTVGQITETVTVVSSEEAPINTTNASIGNTFTSRQIIQLPLAGRNTPGLLSLQPGVTPDTGLRGGVQVGGAVNGGRVDQANVTLDGVDVNEQQGGKAFFSVLRVTPESLQEFRVTTTNADANAGRSSGAQVSLITRGGSNDWHGSAYFYFRPGTFMQANDFFNNSAGIATPSVKRENYGGSFLGPIVKNKWFFSAFYERFVEDKEISVVNEVPLPTLGQGIVRYRTDSGASDPTCPAGTPSGVRCLTSSQINGFYKAANGVTPGINPAALSILAGAASRYKVNDVTVGDGLNTGGFRYNAASPIRNNSFTTRIDGKLTGKQDLSFRYQYQFDNAIAPAFNPVTFASTYPDTPFPGTWNHPMGISVSHTWTLNSNMINKFTYGLTRGSSTIGGDTTGNNIAFRFIYQPSAGATAVTRITPVHNFVDDFTWVKGTHTLNFGANVRLVRNKRTSFGASYDFASTNPSYYDASGDVVTFDDNGDPIFPDVSDASATDLRDALTAVIGRFSQYGLNIQYDKSGKILPVGTGITREFRTEEYETYFQDSWRVTNNLTFNYGVRWSTSTPVYEANGYEVKPTTSLSDFFAKRVAGMQSGVPYNGLLTVDVSGPKNGKSGYYKQDWNNFAPVLAAAWSPNFKSGLLKKLLGSEGKSVFRGGFRMTYDRIGSALAVAFDLGSTLGYKSTSNISANTFNVSDRLGPAITGLNQQLRALPGVPFSGSLTFPLQTPADEDQRIEQSLDDKLTTPYSYNFNLSYGREIFKGVSLEVSYVGRIGRNLLISRDNAHFNDIRDPASGQDFYGVMAQLIGYRNANASIKSIPDIAWFNKFVPGLAGTYSVLGSNVNLTATQAAYRRVAKSAVGGRNTTDFTFIQTLWNDGLGYADNLFVHPQYASFFAYSTIGVSNYNGMQVSLRKRFEKGLSFDFNYTYSHSLDTASGSEGSAGITGGASTIVNALNLKANYASSDFDIRHLVNANFIYELPVGRGRSLFGGANKWVNAFIGGWQLTGVYRWNTGFPIGEPFDDARWATNWNLQSDLVRIKPLDASPSKATAGGPNIFTDPVAAYQSFRNALPGEVGDRNILREPNYVNLDLGLYKTFSVTEKQKITFRFEVFNVTNTQRLTGIANFGSGVDPFNGGTPPSDWGRFTAIQGSPRIVQFAVRYDF